MASTLLFSFDDILQLIQDNLILSIVLGAILLLIIVLAIVLIALSAKAKKLKKAAKEAEAAAPVEEPVKEEKPVEEPVKEEKVEEVPVVEEKPVEEPVKEEKVEEAPVVEEKPVEEPVVEEKPVEEPIPAEEPVVEEEVKREPVEKTTKARSPYVFKPTGKTVTKKAEPVSKGANGGKWVIAPDERGRYGFRLYASNGEVMLESGTPYATLSSAKSGIRTYQTNIAADHLEIAETKNGAFFVQVLNARGGLLATSADYKTRSACASAAESIKRWAQTTTVEETSEFED